MRKEGFTAKTPKKPRKIFRFLGIVILLLSSPLGVFGVLAVQSPSPQRLTHDGLDKQRPCWSPDGKHLAFARHETGGTAIQQYILDVDKPSAPRRLTDRKVPDYNAV